MAGDDEDDDLEIVPEEELEQEEKEEQGEMTVLDQKIFVDMFDDIRKDNNNVSAATSG